jgi:hypothetical protein
MALKQYQILNPNGIPAGTQSCEGSSCFPALQPGQSRVPLPTAGTGATPPKPRMSQITTVSPQGKLVQPPHSLANPTDVPLILDDASSGIDPRLAALEQNIRAQRAGPDLMSDYPAATDVAAPQTPTMAAPPLPMAEMPVPVMPTMPAIPAQAGYAAPMNAPAFANGGAQMPQSSGGYRPTLQGPAGWAGPSSTGVRGGAYIAGNQVRSAADPYGGGGPLYHPRAPARGGHRSPQYNAIRAKGNAMAAKVRGMAANLRGGGGFGGGGGGYRGGGGGGGYGGFSSSSYDTSGPSQKRIDSAYEKYNAQLSHPPPQKATGWAKQTLGPNHGTYPALMTHSLELLAKNGIKVDPFGQSGTYDWMDRLPISDLAMITGGNMMRKSWRPKVPGVLKDLGVKPNKPDFKKEFDYSKYAEELTGLYRGLNGSEYVLDKHRLMTDLAGADKNDALRQGLTQQAYYGDPGGAIERAKGYFNSVFDATEDDLAATVHSRMADRYFAEADLLNRGSKATGGGKMRNVINKGRGGEDLSRMVSDVAKKFGYY